MIKSKQHLKGFTLIELVLVIVLLGVLSSIAIARYADLSGEATEAVVVAVQNNLEAGYRNTQTRWRIDGAEGQDSNTNVDVDIDGIPVRFRNGIPISTADSDHVPVGTPNRGNAGTRLFFLFLNSPTPEIVARTDSSSTGWAMFSGNANCTNLGIGARRRCWEYRQNGVATHRIVYSGNTGEFAIETL
ncbi:MAG: prepilin-type N-terminal cleavage/methylation domain-containing protein [Pseudomonadales bacterium]|nr:prepilin-type N-terminal cleavage/methylation domain-containing protein [Pseudomonadales bacterium]